MESQPTAGVDQANALMRAYCYGWVGGWVGVRALTWWHSLAVLCSLTRSRSWLVRPARGGTPFWVRVDASVGPVGQGGRPFPIERMPLPSRLQRDGPLLG